MKTPDDDDALLVACDSPKESEQPEVEDIQHDDVSETSSTPDETPEESSDEKLQSGSIEGEKIEVEEEKISDEKMEVDVEKIVPSVVIAAPETDENGEEVLECIVMEESEVAEMPKETTPLKLQFMRKFSSAVGKISRPELEEMLVQKITESLMFCSENTELRVRLEKKEKNCEIFKKRLDNVVKQYNDLQMIHTRVMKDLKERPDAPITPVKITRAVGLQVYQPVSRNKNAVTSSSSIFTTQPNKRPNEDSQVNGKSPENMLKKKKRITPLRPGLSETERASLDALEAKEEQKFRTNVSKSISSGPNVALSSSVNGQKKSTPSSIASATSIDLTADEESSPSVAKGGQQVVQPPALVAIRGNSQGSSPRSAYVVKSPIIVPANSAAGKMIHYRSKFF